jgi:hypothetical protein
MRLAHPCRRAALALTLGVASLLAGCKGGLTLGPTIQREVVVVHAGQPVVIRENVTVKAHRADAPDAPFEVDIGGWIAMPPEQFDELMRILLESAPPDAPMPRAHPEGKKGRA